MNRPMFGGNMQNSSVGVGITSGLATPEQQMSDQAFAEAAGGMQQMLSDIDNAESTEGIINAMRGNEASLEQRYQELANYVGEKDAGKTPETVLALVQPTFTMIDLAKQSAPMGGIADAMPMSGGDTSPGNIDMASGISSPGMDEAVMRMTQGEQPVFRQAGSPATGENISGLPFLTSGIPQFQPITTGDIDRGADFYMSQLMPNINKQQAFIDTLTPERNIELLAPYLPKPKTTQDFLTEYQNLLGADDQAANQAQAYLALAKAGQSIAGSDKGLLGAVIDAGGDAVPTLSKLASDQAEKDRTLKLAALKESKDLEKLIEGQKLGIAQKALTSKDALQNELNKTILNAQTQAQTFGFNLTDKNISTINAQAKMEFDANNQFAGLGTETWAKVIENADGTKTLDLIPVRRTSGGVRMREGNIYVDIPEGYAPYTANMEKFKNIKPDLGKFKSTQLLVPVTQKMIDAGVRDNGSGYVELPGFYSDKGAYYVATGDGQLTLAPDGFLKGSMKDAIKISDPDAAGRIRVTNINSGTSWISGLVNQNTGQKIRLGPGLDVLNETPVYDEKGRLVSGNPLVVAKRFDNRELAAVMSTEDLNNVAKRIEHADRLLGLSNEILEAAGEAVGPINNLKQLSNNVIGPFVDQDAWLKFAKTQRGKTLLTQFGRELVKSTALSERYAVAEQQLIEEKLGSPGGWWTAPDLEAVKIMQVMRQIKNFRNRDTALLNRDEVYFEEGIQPQGNRNDPLDFGKQGHYDLFINTINAMSGDKEKLGKIYMYMNRKNAEDQGIEVPRGQEGILITGLDAIQPRRK